MVKAIEGRVRAARREREWRVDRVRDLLLWLGSLLVAIAAATFAALTWSHMGDIGRTGLLVAVTAVAAAGAGVAYRRLPATADALAVLALGLVLVDWFAAQQAGLSAGHTSLVWWAAGTGFDAALAMIAARWLRVAKLASVLLAAAAGVLVVAAVTSAAWATSLGLAAVMIAATAGASVLSRRPAWRVAAVALGAVSGALGVAALAELTPVLPAGNAGQSAGPAAVLMVLAVSPVAARMLVRRLPGLWANILVGVAVALVLGSGVVWLSALFSGTHLLAATAVLAGVAVVASGLLPRSDRLGTMAAGTIAVAITVAGFLHAIMMAFFGPWAWAQLPWSAGPGLQALSHIGPDPTALPAGYPAVVALAAAAVCAATWRRRLPSVVSIRWMSAVLAFGAVGVIAILPLAAGMSIDGVLAVLLAIAVASLAAGTLLDKVGLPEGAAVAAMTVAVAAPAGAWALATRGGTLVFLAVVAGSTAAASRLAVGHALRTALAGVTAAAVIAEIGAAIVAVGGSLGLTGLGVAVAGGCLLVAGASARVRKDVGPTLETIAVVALGIGVSIAASTPFWRAGALTVAMAALAVAGARLDRRPYLWGAAAVAVFAAWAWLGATHVTLLEAYTLPAAAVALGAGGIARRRFANIGSWAAYGGGLAMLLVPTLGAVLAQGGLGRPLFLTAAATLVVVLGARARLQAPLVLGPATLVALGIDTIWPLAAGLPWATLGISGLLLLWIGITAERHLARFRRVRDGYHTFD